MPRFDLIIIGWVLIRTIESVGSNIAVEEIGIREWEEVEEELEREVVTGMELGMDEEAVKEAKGGLGTQEMGNEDWKGQKEINQQKWKLKKEKKK